jgi:glucose/arabinose dehydrogenase
MASVLAPVFTLLFAGTALTQNTCPGAAPATDPAIVAKGFSAYVLVKNLTNPRGLVFDSDGNLLVLEKFRGVTALKLKDDGSCLSVGSTTRVVSDGTVSNAIS